MSRGTACPADGPRAPLRPGAVRAPGPEPVVVEPSDLLTAFRALHEITKRVHASLELTATLDAVAQGVVEVAGFGVAVVNLARGDGLFEVVSVVGDERARDRLLGTDETAAVWRRLLECSTRWGQLRFVDGRAGVVRPDDMFSWVPDIEVSDDPDSWHPLDALFAPLTAPSGEWIGVLSVDLPLSGRHPDPTQLEILELFADQAAIAIQHARMHAALLEREALARHAATHDSLTGLANRSLLMSTAQGLLSEPGTEVAVLVLDLDRFKLVNDTEGHQSGDAVLQEVARRLQGCVRATDLLARTGGDEFVVLISGPGSAASALSLTRRVRAALRAPVRGRVGYYSVGSSIGVAVATAPAALSDLLSEADIAMYAQKRLRTGSTHPTHRSRTG